jgi:hypothetical protein
MGAVTSLILGLKLVQARVFREENENPYVVGPLKTR